MDFTHRIALITGGGNGIGRATSLAFARHGATVVVVDSDLAAAEQTVATIRGGGSTALALRADVTRSEQVQYYVRKTLETYGQIDCFFNNAGIGGRVVHVAEADEADFDAVMDVNLKGAFLGLRHVLPPMLARGSGAVVNTASVAPLSPTPGMAAYAASKNAVIGLTKTAAGEVARHGVRVNGVCPGPVETRAQRWLVEQLVPAHAEQAVRKSRSALPTGRYSTPEEVANVVLFLCSDLSSNTTGAQYVVDGGRSAVGAGSVTGPPAG